MGDKGVKLEVEQGKARATITKTAHNADLERLKNELTMLNVAAHPNVVALADNTVLQGPNGPFLRMVFAGSRTLATIGQVEPTRAAGLIAALATTVADLHDKGIVHHRLTPDHIILAPDGRPIICGFASASQAQDSNESTVDVAALGELLTFLVMPKPSTPETFGWKYRRGDDYRVILLTLADQATADDPLRRPSARQLAALISNAVPEASFHPSDRTSPASTPITVQAKKIDGIILGGAAIALIGITLVIWSIWGMGESPQPFGEGLAENISVDPPAPTPTSIEPLRPTSTLTATTSTILPPTSPPDESNQININKHEPIMEALGCSTYLLNAPATPTGEPCPVDLALHNGVLTVGEVKFAVELDEAAIAIGDFDCSGSPLPAIADLSNGQIFLFQSWATPDNPTTATHLNKIVNTRQLIVEPRVGQPGCHQLVALDSWGIRHVIQQTETENS